MGIKYTHKMVCPECEHTQDVYYNPDRGFATHRCHYCGYVADLKKHHKWITRETARQMADRLVKLAIKRKDGNQVYRRNRLP